MRAQKLSRMVLLFAACLFAAGGASAAVTEAPRPAPEAEPVTPAPDADPGTSWLDGRRVRLTASTGVDFSTGDYGTGVDSDIWNVPFGLKFELDPFVLRVTVPYVVINGPVTLVGDNPEPLPGFTNTRDGIGDVLVAASYVFFPEPQWLPVMEFTGKVKFGTASASKGLGTGEIDYALQFDVSKTFGIVTPFAGAGYKFIGDPSGIDLQNKAYASAGGSVRVASWLSAGVAYDWSQSSVPGRPDSHELSPFGTIKLGRYFRIDPYAVIGLSQNAPDWGAGLQLRFVLERD